MALGFLLDVFALFIVLLQLRFVIGFHFSCGFALGAKHHEQVQSQFDVVSLMRDAW